MNSLAVHKTSFRILVLALIMGVSACSYTPKKVSKPQLVAEPDPVSLMLADAADKASKSLETLASIEQYRTPQGGVSTIPNAPAELRRGMSVQWVGPAEPLIKTIADKASYEYIVLGDQPPAPIVISVDAQNKQIIDVLRDIGLQMGQRADLKVDGARRVIELQYAPAIGAQTFK
jgi:defect-in-organelle-trafficking protein DotD